MEFVGRKVKKDFEGQGGFGGTVRSYDSSRGVYKIEYEDGNSEEVELPKMISLLHDCDGDDDDDGQANKRRRLGDFVSGKGNCCFDSGSGDRIRPIPELDLNAGAGLDLNLNLNLNLNEGLDLNCVGNDELDLNCGVVVVIDDDDDDSNSNVENKVGKSRDEIIDLNLDVNEDEDENDNLQEEGHLNVRKGHCFDLNLGLDEESKDLLDGVICEEQFKKSSCEIAGKDSLVEEEGNCGNVAVEEVQLGNKEVEQCSASLENELTESNLVEVELKTPFHNDGFSTVFRLDTDTVSGSAPKGRRGRKRKVPLDTDINSAKETGLTESNPVEINLKTPLHNEGSANPVEIELKTPLHNDGSANPVEIELKTPLNNDGGAAVFKSNTDTVSGSAPKGRRGRKRKVPLYTDTNSATENELTECNPIEIELKTPLHNDGCATGFGSNTDTVSGNAPKGRRGRKRKVPLDTDANSTTKTVLRRSTRRLRKAACLDQHNASGTVMVPDAVNDLSSSPTISAVTEEKVAEIVGQEGSEEQNVLPPKLALPLSSGNLNLGNMPVIDVFSIYSFLRSFSTLLLLSPFELEDFVSSMNCNAPSLLFDTIHVSLLNTLRKHLESLPEDSSQSASHCLRSHNWDLLDMITWPIFLVDYLLIHSTGLKPGFDICCLKLFESDYYKQSPSVKIEILRCLCDDVIEVDLIKSELNKRSQATEPSIDFDRHMKSDNIQKRKAVMDVAGSCVTEEDNDEAVDWNSDECCLCKMDGNLICCDGCPAAFHSRCVGVVSNHLPEGDWYCPECMIDKDKPWMKVGKTIRGADLLGIDPYGQLYYSCCGYLLVLEDCQSATSFKYYRRNDLPGVVEVLKSSEIVYCTIMSAILKQWDLSSEVDGAKKECGLQDGVALQIPAHSGTHSQVTEVKAEDTSLVSTNVEGEVSELVGVKSDIVDHAMNIGNQILNSEVSADIAQAGTRNTEKTRFYLRSRHSSVSGKCQTPRKLSITSRTLAGNNDSAKHGHDSSLINSRIVSQASCCTSYVNYYHFAQTASAIADELTGKSSNEGPEDVLKSVDDIVSDQMKAISGKFMEFCWPNVLNINFDARKETCGWCFSCKVPEHERECLISMYTNGPSLENFTSEVLGIRSRKNKKSHLVDIICHILCIEERLQGLLLGPWLNPQYSKFWRGSVLRLTGIASVKSLLLKLESNLRHLALSADWTKHVDSAVSVGSAVHIVTASVRGSSRNGIARKRARYPEPESNATSNAASGLGLLWWRGGRLSRRLFDWKVLPCALASKAARQAGCKKIPGILYPDGSEFAKRSKYVTWRAGVESSRTVEQLALQVRELDANIRWDDIENNNISIKLEKESKKPIKSFKKAIVRRKCTEGTAVKYLLDFGKRRFIPDVVLRHGSKVEESSSERKKYWLEESYLPLHLLKAFEQKRLARKSNKLNSGKLQERKRVVKQPLKRKGFSYLFSKAERSENYQCGHCNKDVHMREAVSCQYCKGFFHKRHVRKSAGAITSECIFTCHKCQDKMYLRTNATKKRLESQKNIKASKQLRPLQSKLRKKDGRNKQLRQIRKNKKVTVVVPLRRSPRKAKCVSLQNKKIRAHKRGKQRKSIKVASKKQLKCTWQKKRSPRYPIYWLNGLHLSKKPNDERLLHFKSKNLLLLCGDSTSSIHKPRCSLCCELEFSSTLSYIACELCGDWFHGDALDLKQEQIDILVGFRCHVCLSRSPLCCPHLGAARIEGPILVELNNDEGVDTVLNETDAPAFSSEAFVEQDFQLCEESKNLSLAGEHDESQLSLNQTIKFDEIEQLASSSVQKAEAVEEVCSEDRGHAQQPNELMTSNEGALMQKDAINSAEVPQESTSPFERDPCYPNPVRIFQKKT